MQKLIITLCFLFSLCTFSQTETLTIKTLKGQIIHAENKKVLSAAHILNLNTVSGTITNDLGYFELPTRANYSC